MIPSVSAVPEVIFWAAGIVLLIVLLDCIERLVK